MAFNEQDRQRLFEQIKMNESKYTIPSCTYKIIDKAGKCVCTLIYPIKEAEYEHREFCYKEDMVEKKIGRKKKLELIAEFELDVLKTLRILQKNERSRNYRLIKPNH